MAGHEHKFQGNGQSGFYDGQSARIRYCQGGGYCQAVQYQKPGNPTWVWGERRYVSKRPPHR